LINLKPKDEDGYLKRSRLYELKGDLPKAIADCDQALKIKPNDKEVQSRKKALEALQNQPPPLPSPPPRHSPAAPQPAPTKAS